MVGDGNEGGLEVMKPRAPGDFSCVVECSVSSGICGWQTVGTTPAAKQRLTP